MLYGILTVSAPCAVSGSTTGDSIVVDSALYFSGRQACFDEGDVLTEGIDINLKSRQIC